MTHLVVALSIINREYSSLCVNIADTVRYIVYHLLCSRHTKLIVHARMYYSLASMQVTHALVPVMQYYVIVHPELQNHL